MPTFHVCPITPVLGSSATTVFCPLTAAYRVDLSGEYAIWPVSAACPLAVGMVYVTGVPSVPSLLTGKRLRPVCSGTHSILPLGEYVGPSWPTVAFVNRWLALAAVPTDQISL